MTSLVLRELQSLIRDAEPSDLRIMLKSVPHNVFIDYFEDNPEMRYVAFYHSKLNDKGLYKETK